jgi:hypothetical protein
MFVRIHRIEPGKNHGLIVFEAGQSLAATDVSSSVMVSPILVSATFLMVADDESNFTGRQVRRISSWLRRQYARRDST